jgi:hypothetical protein
MVGQQTEQMAVISTSLDIGVDIPEVGPGG